MSSADKNVCRFDHFMQHALHDPSIGYYTRNIQTVGASGDFSTTATLSNLLGKAIAHHAIKWQQQFKTPLNLIEIGGGDGSLANSVIQSLPLVKRWKCNYHLVESSFTLTKKQQESKKLSKKITWHSDMQSALENCHGVAFIFSNELVDAFPVRIFQHTNNSSTWKELHIDGLNEILCEADHLPESSSFITYKHSPQQRIEVHESYHEWLISWRKYWKQGQMLTVDYGDIHPNIYYRMPKGTLRAYSHHQHITGKAVYQNPGKQDITTDVNFTDLIQWGDKLNLKTLSLISQNELLTPFATDKPEDQFLIHPDGAGSAFKALLQQCDE